MPRAPFQPAPRATSSPSDIAIVVSRYNASITDRLLEGAVSAYQAHGGSPGDLTIIDAPGAYELPALCDAAAATGRFAGVLALGCVIKGETSHDQHIAAAVAHGLVNVTLLTGVPVALGVLTVNNPLQARQRAGGKLGNKGAQAMDALLLTIEQVQRLRSGPMAGAPSVIGRVPVTDKAAPPPLARPRGAPDRGGGGRAGGRGGA